VCRILQPITWALAELPGWRYNSAKNQIEPARPGVFLKSALRAKGGTLVPMVGF